MFHRPKTEQVTKNENAAEEKNLLNQTQDTQEDVIRTIAYHKRFCWNPT